ncbi:hypothetical protein D0U04_24595 [Bacillus clarus]|uniref:ABC transporter permease n=2 Tax=Bacillus clarus TaxID=2338372 RepID=A0ABX9KQL0_9BACI|nr:hypothetical protein [Bacillus clarus]RFT63550.1 hypothetical protein D0U04_24595 [Bacillus clarus]
MREIRGGKMIFEIIGSFIAVFLFLFSYKQLKKIHHQETSTYFDGLDSMHVSITHDSSTDM